MSAVDANSILQTAMRLLGPQLDVEATDFHLDLGSALPPILADSNQLLHVFLHLSGQISALPHPEQDSGVYIRTRHEGYAVSIEFSSEMPPSSTSFQLLQDLGSGVQPSTLSLGACSRIVTEHGGRILAQRSSDGYIAFRVELPVAVKSSTQSDLASVPNRAVAGSSS
jgi:nitrogen-specific signal transduction histidine kinase